MSDLIQPRTRKGFCDYLPEIKIPRKPLARIRVRACAVSMGSLPSIQLLLEYTEILLGKGGEESDKLIYRFVDHGGRDVAARASI